MATKTQFKRIRSITLSVLKLTPGTPRFFYLNGPIFTGKAIASQNMAAPEMVKAIDLETGEEGVVILSTAMHKELREAYPGEGYAGRCFELCITRAADKAAGIKYNHVSVSEVSAPDGFEPPAPMESDTTPAAGKAGKGGK